MKPFEACVTDISVCSHSCWHYHCCVACVTRGVTSGARGYDCPGGQSLWGCRITAGSAHDCRGAEKSDDVTVTYNINLSQEELKLVLKFTFDEFFKISNIQVRNVTNLLIQTAERTPVLLIIEIIKLETLQIERYRVK